MLPHALKEWLNVIDRRGVLEFALVKPQTYPQVIYLNLSAGTPNRMVSLTHQDWKPNHHGSHTDWASKLVRLMLVQLFIHLLTMFCRKGIDLQNRDGFSICDIVRIEHS